MQVGRIVPLIWQRRSHRHSSAEENAGAGLDVGEVGDADNDFFTYSQGFLEGVVGFFNLLKRLVQNNVVEVAVGVFGEPCVDVLLVNA